MPEPAPPFILLAIEISNPPLTTGGGEIALAQQTPDDDTRIIASTAVSTSGRHDDALMPAIDRLCAAHRVAPGDLARVAVSAGPGGFTSVRIAVTTTKMIAMATRARLVLVPTALVAWIGVEPTIRDALPTRIVLAWKRDDAYCVDYMPGSVPTICPPPRVLSLSEIAGDPTRHVVADARLIEHLRGHDARAPMHEARLSAESVAKASMLLQPSDPLTAAPIYPREPEAVTKWRELGKSKHRA